MHHFVIYRKAYINYYFNIIHFLIKKNTNKISLLFLKYDKKNEDELTKKDLKKFFPNHLLEKIKFRLFEEKQDIIKFLSLKNNSGNLYVFPSDFKTVFSKFNEINFVQNDIDFLKSPFNELKIANNIYLFNREWKEILIKRFRKKSVSNENINNFSKKIIFNGVKNTLGLISLNKHKLNIDSTKKYILFIPTEHYVYEKEFKVISYDRNLLGFLKTIIFNPLLFRYIRYNERKLFKHLVSYAKKNEFEIIVKFRRKKGLKLSNIMLKESSHVFYEDSALPANLLTIVRHCEFAVLFYKSMIISELNRLSLKTYTVLFKEDKITDELLQDQKIKLFVKNKNRIITPQIFLKLFR